MRMSEIASEAIQTKLLTISAVTGVVGSRIVNRAYVPQDMDLPAVFHYAEPGGGGYDSTINAGFLPSSLTLRYVVRLICQGESTDPIDDAADAILAAFSGQLAAQAGYAVNVWPVEPWPQSFGVGGLVEGGTVYSETGDFYTVEVLKTGG